MRQYWLLALLCMPLCATVNVRDYGAQGDGVADDTAALNAAFGTACAASEDVYIPTGTYLTSSLDHLEGCGISFYGEGNTNSILKLRSAASPAILTLTGAAGQALTLQNLAFDGGGLEGAGITIEQYQSVIINRVLVQDFGCPGYALGHKSPYDGLYIRNVEHVSVTDSQFTGNERAGVELQAVHLSTVSNSVMSRNGGMGGVSEQNFEGPLDGPLVARWLDNTLVNNGSGGIDVETDPKLAPARALIQGNHVLDCGNDIWDSGWGIVIGLHAFGIISDNLVENFAASAFPSDYANAIVYVRNGGPISIVSNKIRGTKAHGILGNDGAFPVIISGNTLENNGTGIFIYKSPRIQILNNTVAKSSGLGIDISWSGGSTITGNHLSGNMRNLRINGHSAMQR